MQVGVGLRPTPTGKSLCGSGGDTSPPLLVSGNIILKLFDDELLLGDDRFDYITDRDYTQQLVASIDRQMADALFGDQLHAVLDGLI